MLTAEDSLSNSGMKIVMLLCMVVIFSCCKSTKDSQSMDMDQVKAELRTNESSEVVCEDNEEGTFTLCYNKVEEDPLNPRYLLKFAVVDKSTGETVHKESVTGGYVKWLDSNSIEYFSAPGIVPEGKTKNDYTKVYKPKTGKTVTKEAFLLEKKQ